MGLEAYEEEVLSSMYDKRIIAMGYTSIQKIASRIGWSNIAKKYKVKKSFERIIRHLASKGYVVLHGKSGNVASLSKLGVAYVIGKLQRVREVLGLELMTALELFDKRQNAKRITTASKNLDNLLGGGLETQAITEFIGEYGAGKSQICMQLCVTAQQPPEQGGLGGKVLFLDTEGTFAPQRVNDIAKARGLDQKKTLENILYARCYNSDHQILLVDKASKIIEEEGIKLLIVDSLISHFRGEYVGREMLSERQQRLNQHIHKLLRLAELYNCAVVVTNQIQSNPQAFYGDPNRPAGGNVVAHASTHRLYIRKGKANTRIIHVIDSPYLPENQTRFAITEKGVEDAEEK